MRRLSWQQLRDIFRLVGFVDRGMEGDHLMMTRPGTPRPIVIKMDRNLGEDIIQSNKRTAGLTSAQFRDLAEQVCGKKKRKKKGKK